MAEAASKARAGAVMRKGEYARHRAVSAAMVSHWINAGRIALTADGLVDVVTSDRMLAASNEPSRGGKSHGAPATSRAPRGRAASAIGRAGSGSRRSPAPAGDAAGGGSDDDAPDPVDFDDGLHAPNSFQAARAARERIAAKAAELAYRKAAGELVEASEVVRLIEDAVGPAMAALDTLALRVVGRIVPAGDGVAPAQRLVDEEVAAVREQVAEAVRALGDRLGRRR